VTPRRAPKPFGHAAAASLLLLGAAGGAGAQEISIGDVMVVEGNTGTMNAVFPVTIQFVKGQVVSVDFQTSDGTATVGDQDYLPSSGSVMFSGKIDPEVQFVTVQVVGDTSAEADEDFFVDLSNATGGIIVDDQGAGLILNDDAVVVSIADVTLTEGDAGTVDALFTVSLGGGTSPNTVTVDAATRDGTATAQGGDYLPSSGQVSFAPGATTASFRVSVRGDTEDEPDEVFFVDLSNPSAGSIGDGEGAGTIEDDDEEAEEVSEIRLTDPPSVGEAAGAAMVSVRRTGSSGAARVTVSAVSNTATAGDDFVAVSEVVTWADGQDGPRAVAIPILDDNLEEGNEAARIELSSPVGAVVVGPSTADLTIRDDDVPGGVQGVGESETLALVNSAVGLEVQVLRADGTPVQGTTVFWSVAEGDAELTAGETTLSDADGIAANDVALGGSPGRVVITASLAGGGEAATFEITVQGDLGELVDPAASPGEASIAAVFDTSCIGAEGSFADACDYLFGLTDPADRLQLLRELTPREVAAQGTLSLDAVRIQLRNVGGRLADLRRGGDTGGGADQLSFRSGSDGFTIAQLRPDSRTRADAAFLRRLEGDWWKATLADEGGAATESRVLEEESAPRWGLFVNGSISMGDRTGTAQEEGFDLETSGVTAGLDRRVGNRGVLGAALGVLDTDVSLERSGGGLAAEGLSATVYGLYFREAFYLSGVVTLGRLDFDLERVIDLPAPFEGSDRLTAAGATEADQLSIALEAGYDRSLGAVTVGGFTRLSSVDAEIEDYAESGAGPFALAVLGQDIESLLAEAGVQWSYAASRSWGVVQPVLHAAYLHEFEDSSRLVRGRFLEDVEARDFALPTDTPDRDYLNLGAGLTFTLTGGRSFFLIYDTDLERDDLEVYTLSFGLRWEL
jgi:uncharacterized protein YhjY with autotransporter beta-barrel domain